MRVAAYTGGQTVPSARMRVRQYIEPLGNLAIKVEEHPLPWGDSLPRRRVLRPFWMAGSAAQRCVALTRSWSADVSWIQRQLLPAFVPIQRLSKSPRVLDVDDAVWLNTGGRRASQLAKDCDIVVCGNRFLAEYFSQWNKNVTVIPTAVDTAGVALATVESDSHPVIGWTGTSGNLGFLYGIEAALKVVLEKHPTTTLLIVSDQEPRFMHIRKEQYHFVLWTPVAEAEALRSMSIGIMPLVDDLWCAGKCSFKMIKYMAAALPVVVTQVGMNAEVLRLGEVGIGVTSVDDWIGALDLLLRKPTLRRVYGQTGRSVACEYFDVRILSRRYANIFRTVGGGDALA